MALAQAMGNSAFGVASPVRKDCLIAWTVIGGDGALLGILLPFAPCWMHSRTATLQDIFLVLLHYMEDRIA